MLQLHLHQYFCNAHNDGHDDPGALDRKVQDAIYNGVVVGPTEKNYTHWQKDNRAPNGAEVYLIYNWFNITNPAAVMNGAAPKVVKLGPYVFQKFVTEGQVQYFDGFTKRASRKFGELRFIPSRSQGKLSDMVYIDNLFAAWLWPHCNGDLQDDDATKKIFKVVDICLWIAQNGIFYKGTIGELMYGTKMNGFAFRYNNGHTVCPSNVPTCREDWVATQYDPHSGDCSAPKKCGGQWSNNWAAKKMKEMVTLTGYGNEGCRRPLENQGCFTQKKCDRPFDREDEDHSTICTAKQQVAKTAMNIGSTSDAKFSFIPHKTPPPLAGFDYNSFDATKMEQWFTNVYQWYDETPYDTSDDKDVEKTFAQDEGKPCKWDGSTNGDTGCPHFEKVHGFHELGQGLFYPPRQAKEDFTVFDNIFFRRPMPLKFQAVEDVHAADCVKYKPADSFYTADGANKKYGADSSAKFHEYPGAASFPMRRQELGIPVVWTLPHWHRGGDISDKWNQAISLRKSNKFDDMTFWYEPLTGAPFDTNFHVQWNMVWPEKPNGCKIINATSGETRYDFKNLDLSAHGLGTVDLSQMGKWMSTVDARCQGNTGCDSMHPSWSMRISIELTPHLAAKIRNLVFGLKKLTGLQSMLSQLMIFGVCLIIANFGCMTWKYFGPEDDKSSALQAAA